MDSVPRPSYRPNHWRIDRARSNWSSFLMWHDGKFRGVYCKIRSVGLGMRWSSRLKILSQSFGNESSLTLFCTPKVFDEMNDFLKRFWEIETHTVTKIRPLRRWVYPLCMMGSITKIERNNVHRLISVPFTESLPSLPTLKSFCILKASGSQIYCSSSLRRKKPVRGKQRKFRQEWLVKYALFVYHRVLSWVRSYLLSWWTICWDPGVPGLNLLMI